MITDYLAELIGALDTSPARRRRIVAEVEDHLQCAAAELHAAGLSCDAAEREAVRRFGPAGALAATFREDEAAIAARGAGRAAMILAALIVLAVADPPGIVTWARAGFPAGLVTFVFGQIACVAAGLTLMRCYRARATRGPRGVRLTLVLRGTLVVTVCAAVIFACGLAVVATAPGTTPLLTVAALVALGGAIASSGRTVCRARRRAAAAGIDRAAGPTAQDDALSDLAALSDPVLGPLLRRVPRLLAWLHLRRHPWRVASLLALACGVPLGIANIVGEGGLPAPGRIPLALLAGFVIVAIEATAVLLSFLALGRYLGIRPASEAARSR